MRNLPGSIAAALLVLLAPVGCCRGDLVAKAELRAPGTAVARFQPHPKGVQLWANTDGTWTGSKNSHMPLAYKIEVSQGGKSLGQIQCDTEHVSTSVCGSQVTVNSEHTADCELKLECELPALSTGEVVLKVTGTAADPSRVKNIKDMSIFVRAK